jgi:hypothetical protein
VKRVLLWRTFLLLLLVERRLLCRSLLLAKIVSVANIAVEAPSGKKAPVQSVVAGGKGASVEDNTIEEEEKDDANNICPAEAAKKVTHSNNNNNHVVEK